LESLERAKKMTSNFAKPPKLWSRAPGCEVNARNTQVRTLAKLDGRTKCGRIVNELRRELFKHFNDVPNAVEKSHIERCCALRAKLAVLEAKVIEGRETTMDTAHFIAWENAYRRNLQALRFGEATKSVRNMVEARMMRTK
jgi:hypothetical protein